LSDYSQQLNTAYLQLQLIRDATKQGEIDKVAEIAKAVDWETVASEFESVPIRYSRAVYRHDRHGRRIMRNLLLPYITYQDCVKLGLQIDMLRYAIEDSPSLLTTATDQLESAYQRELQRRRNHKKPATLPWATIETLIDAANAKIQWGRELEAATNAEFIAGGRIYPYKS